MTNAQWSGKAVVLVDTIFPAKSSREAQGLFCCPFFPCHFFPTRWKKCRQANGHKKTVKCWTNKHKVNKKKKIKEEEAKSPSLERQTVFCALLGWVDLGPTGSV
ncbi:hypothetical protein QOT17_014431 [Balamuthia mandrillaris]